MDEPIGAEEEQKTFGRNLAITKFRREDLPLGEFRVGKVIHFPGILALSCIECKILNQPSGIPRKQETFISVSE